MTSSIVFPNNDVWSSTSYLGLPVQTLFTGSLVCKQVTTVNPGSKNKHRCLDNVEVELCTPRDCEQTLPTPN